MPHYHQIWLSAETKSQAENILKHMVSKKLIVGGTILNGPSRFWWEGEETDMEYFYVMGFSIAKKRILIEEEFKKISEEDVPMASFVSFEGNKEFQNYIDTNA